MREPPRDRMSVPSGRPRSPAPWTPPLAQAAQLLGWPTQSERIRVRVAFKLGLADEPLSRLPTQTEGIAHHGGHSPAGKPLPDIRESARPLRHSRLGPHAQTGKFGSIRGEYSYTCILAHSVSVLGGPAVCRTCRAILMKKRTLPNQSPGRSSRRLKRVCLPPESPSQCQRVALGICVLAR